MAKKADVEVGQVWVVRVGGVLSPVRITVIQEVGIRRTSRLIFGINQRTSKLVGPMSAQQLRRRITDASEWAMALDGKVLGG